jgi:GTP diphosphokinase / guanosine-3',5'-bis(diphosphate) 3'-diphosphatase
MDPTTDPVAVLEARLREAVARYLPDRDTRDIWRALEFARAAHAHQRRLSGEPYVTHCLSVAIILTDLLRRGADPVILEGALLHDVLEENKSVTRDQLRREFGEEVALLVDGVTKIGGVPFRNPEAVQSENFRKMLLSMAKDIRVILIKLADRLHNMRTISAHREEKRRRIAQETHDIYAMLAHRLGIAHLKWELEDLSFKELEPESYRRVSELVATKRAEREEAIARVLEPLSQRLRAEEIKAEITGRPKSFYSIWQKMERTGGTLDGIHDLLGIRVITETREDCYRVLGIVHDLFLPMQDRFKDYVASPKSNMYQSLHTTVIGPQARRVEIQIRTRQMHLVAEYGIAAHYQYKAGGKVENELERKLGEFLVRGTTEWQEEAENPREFMDLLRVALYQDEVFVFTPRGELKQLPRGATPIDFAYAVHTAVGSHCVGARVNGRLVRLGYELKSGDIVEILTSPSAVPREEWMNQVRTTRARQKVRHWLKQQRLTDSIALGREMLERELRKRRRKLPAEDELTELAQSFSLEDAALLFARIGEGDLSAQAVANRAYPEASPPAAPTSPSAVDRLRDLARRPSRGVKIQGISSLMINMAQCCHPLPGDRIVGIVTRGRGVSIHRGDCPNTFEDRVERERLVEVSWDVERDTVFLARVIVRGADRPSMLGEIATAIGKIGSNIRQASVTSDEGEAVGDFLLEVRNLHHLDRVRRAVLGVKGVRAVDRRQMFPSGTKEDT